MAFKKNHTIAQKRIRRPSTTSSPINPLRPETTSALVTTGIYRYSRNPMYVGFALFLLAFAVLLSSPGALLGVLGFVLYIDRFQILPEEQALNVLFGADFTNYCTQVRRWL
ncbi:methyltransferase family protein [Paenochrobactrum gallinarii]|uniref:methyltransferase family protein n=1 Tax=Paenochrobactrum gallinarii TaxID=643673 RepID=UPI001AEDCDAD